ncbi:MAG TPA: GGDEF domain-containing protein, partial [Candidatus Baltobacteraceae bacterium]|nr:GGDEF domain-containing protein [Candidatus Baltobacteraceae bacterium]
MTSRPLPPEELFQASLDVLRRACGQVRVHAAGDPAPDGALAVDFPDDDSQPRQLVVLCDQHGSPPIDREALEIAALQIAGALRAARERGEETPRGAAWTDALTGIANRRAFDRTLASEFARAKNSGAPLSLALLDVDFFKDFNDRYGHVEGDRCLREVAQTIAAGIRKEADFCA